jgi:hypothetical protein
VIKLLVKDSTDETGDADIHEDTLVRIVGMVTAMHPKGQNDDVSLLYDLTTFSLKRSREKQ